MLNNPKNDEIIDSSSWTDEQKKGFANDLFNLIQGFIDLEDDTENNDK